MIANCQRKLARLLPVHHRTRSSFTLDLEAISPFNQTDNLIVQDEGGGVCSVNQTLCVCLLWSRLWLQQLVAVAATGASSASGTSRASGAAVPSPTTGGQCRAWPSPGTTASSSPSVSPTGFKVLKTIEGLLKSLKK